MANNQIKKSYPKYKPSGIGWLGEVPEHWDIKRLKLCSQIRVSNVDKKTIEDDLDFMDATATKEEIRKFRVREGDVIITKDSESWDDIAVPAYVKRATPEMICGYHLAHIRPYSTILSGKYLLRAFLAEGIRDQFRVSASGVTRFGLPKKAIDNSLFPIPPMLEQQAIADFLDRKTGRIDLLIEKKRQFIERLKEKRTALISHVITKGLDPAVKLKPSGIDWLGDVPEHWKVRCLKYILWLQRGHDLPATEFSEDGYPVYGSNGRIGHYPIFTTKGPGITVGRSGSVGEVNYIEGDYWAHNTSLYVKEFRNADVRFAFYLLISLNLAHLASGSAVGTLNRNNIHVLKIPVPNMAEQKTIANYLDRETDRIDCLINNIEKAIRKLKEYRSAIISAAVTGKIKVDI